MAFLQFICVFLSYFIIFVHRWVYFWNWIGLDMFAWVKTIRWQFSAIVLCSLQTCFVCFIAFHFIVILFVLIYPSILFFNIFYRDEFAGWLVGCLAESSEYRLFFAFTCCCQTKKKLASHISKLSNGFFFIAQSLPLLRQFAELGFDKGSSSLMFLIFCRFLLRSAETTRNINEQFSSSF